MRVGQGAWGKSWEIMKLAILALAVVTGFSEGKPGLLRARRSDVVNGVSAKCTHSHLEEDCAVTGLPVIKDIGFDAKIDDVNYVINVDILWDGKSYSILNLSAHNPEVCIDELVVAKVCAKVENLQWGDDRVTGTLYVGVVLVGTEYFKVVDLDVPYASRDIVRERAALARRDRRAGNGSSGEIDAPTACASGPRRARDFSTGHMRRARQQVYQSVRPETDADSCDQQTLVGCSWEGHPCSKDADCEQFCPAAIGADACPRLQVLVEIKRAAPNSGSGIMKY